MNARSQSLPRVYVLDNSRQMTGALRSSLNLAVHLNDQFHFTYWLPAISLIKEVSVQGIDVRFISFLELRKNFSLIFYFPTLIFNSIKIARTAKRENVQVIHVNDLYNMCGAVIKILYPKIKIVYHVRLLPDSYIKSMFRIWARLINNYADKIIAVSQVVASQWPGKRKLVVIHDATKEPAEKNLHFDNNNTIKLLYLANFIEGKGHNFAIEAFEEARKKFPELSMTMAGGDMGLKKNQSYKQSLNDRVSKKGLSGVVNLIGFEKDVSRLLLSHDIFLNFSESESFSMTCLEAMSSRIPVIATRCGGPEELIENGISGILVNNRDVCAMSREIVKLASDYQARIRLADAALVRIKDYFSIELSAARMVDLYAGFNSPGSH